MCVTALLSACVAVCLWDARERVAGVRHFARPRADGCPALPGRYGDTSTRLLLEEMRRWGCEFAQLQAKVFGGAQVEVGQGVRKRVGERNVAVALDTLREAGVRLAAADVGGGRGRRLLFLTDVGRASVWHL